MAHTTHEFLSHQFSASISSHPSCLYLSSTLLPTNSLFSLLSEPIFPSTLSWIYPVSNTPPFSLFTITN